MILGHDNFNSIRRRWPRAIAWGLLGVTICCEVLAQTSCSAAAAAGTNQNAPDSGISGAMVAAWGNPPANPPTYQCVKIFDATGRNLIATGVCSGIWASFRVPLPAGRYLVDESNLKPGAGPSEAAPGSIPVQVAPGQWVNIRPKSPPGPLP